MVGIGFFLKKTVFPHIRPTVIIFFSAFNSKVTVVHNLNVLKELLEPGYYSRGVLLYEEIRCVYSEYIESQYFQHSSRKF